MAATWVPASREGEGQTRKTPWSVPQRADASTRPQPPQSDPKNVLVHKIECKNIHPPPQKNASSRACRAQAGASRGIPLRFPLTRLGECRIFYQEARRGRAESVVGLAVKSVSLDSTPGNKFVILRRSDEDRRRTSTKHDQAPSHRAGLPRSLFGRCECVPTRPATPHPDSPGCPSSPRFPASTPRKPCTAKQSYAAPLSISASPGYSPQTFHPQTSPLRPDRT